MDPTKKQPHQNIVVYTLIMKFFILTPPLAKLAPYPNNTSPPLKSKFSKPLQEGSFSRIVTFPL